MKRSASLFLAALMVVSMTLLASCDSSKEPDDTTKPAADNKTTTAAPAGDKTTPAGDNNGDTTTKAPDADPTEPDIVAPSVETAYLVSTTATWKWQTFECVYNSGGAGGEYTTDALADYMAGFGWNLGDETIPADALADILGGENEAVGPFGDCNVSNYWNEFDEPMANNPEVDWSGDKHGLVIGTTFTIEDLAKFKEDYSEVFFTFWYDNTPSVYLNGQLVFYKNGELGALYNDWVDDFRTFTSIDDEMANYLNGDELIDRLVEGENTVVIIMKDAWGGRECCFEMAAE